MSDLTSVPGPPNPLQGTSGKIVAVVVIGILIAVIKPWGDSSIATAPPATLPPPSATSASSAEPAHEAFDFGVFEGFEPQPAWEIWPAGREISFGFAMRIDPDPDGSALATAVPLGSGPPPPSAAPEPSGAASGGADPPVWTDSISISPASTLTVIAINRPRGVTIPAARLSQVVAGQGRVDIPTVQLPSPWPDHFLVLGIDDGTGTGALAAWPPGRYALSLDIEPGGYTRTIGIIVGARAPVAPSEVPAPAGSGDPAGSAAPVARPG